MGQKYWNKKYLVMFILIMVAMKNAAAQSLILRPSFGTRYYSTKPSTESSNNFDPSFIGTHKFKERAATIALELMYKKHSYEMVFTSHHISNALYTNYKDVLSFGYYSQGGISQFQFAYNKFFDIENKRCQFIRPFIGMGVGIGFNRPQEVYDQDTFYTVFRKYALFDSTKYLDMDTREKRLANNSFSLVFKAGFAFKRKNIERLRLTLVYNLGLNNLTRTNITYAHTNTKYSGTSYSKGSQFSILLSVPIYLKRKK